MTNEALCSVEINDVANLLDRTTNTLRRGNYGDLKQLSDGIIHCASIFQTEHSITVAVILYALSKVYSRLEQPSYITTKKIINLIENGKQAILSKNEEGTIKNLRQITNEITKVDKKMDLYIRKVIEEAEIKKGSRIYEHGISLSKAANMLGISQWDLMSYIGNTKIHEFAKEDVPAAKRLEYARSLFA